MPGTHLTLNVPSPHPLQFTDHSVYTTERRLCWSQADDYTWQFSAIPWSTITHFISVVHWISLITLSISEKGIHNFSWPNVRSHFNFIQSHVLCCPSLNFPLHSVITTARGGALSVIVITTTQNIFHKNKGFLDYLAKVLRRLKRWSRLFRVFQAPISFLKWNKNRKSKSKRSYTSCQTISACLKELNNGLVPAS